MLSENDLVFLGALSIISGIYAHDSYIDNNDLLKAITLSKKLYSSIFNENKNEENIICD